MSFLDRRPAEICPLRIATKFIEGVHYAKVEPSMRLHP